MRGPGQLLLALALGLALGLPPAAAQAWPPALSLSTGEAQRGQQLQAWATAPSSAELALQLPPGLRAQLLDRQGDTAIWRLTVDAAAPLDRQPHLVRLLIDGAPAAAAAIRIWTEEPRGWRLALPILQRAEGTR